MDLFACQISFSLSYELFHGVAVAIDKLARNCILALVCRGRDGKIGLGGAINLSQGIDIRDG